MHKTYRRWCAQCISDTARLLDRQVQSRSLIRASRPTFPGTGNPSVAGWPRSKQDGVRRWSSTLVGEAKRVKFIALLQYLCVDLLVMEHRRRILCHMYFATMITRSNVSTCPRLHGCTAMRAGFAVAIPLEAATGIVGQGVCTQHAARSADGHAPSILRRFAVALRAHEVSSIINAVARLHLEAALGLHGQLWA